MRRYVSLDDLREALEHAPPGSLINGLGPIGMRWSDATRRRPFRRVIPDRP